MTHERRQPGFTLIELLVVISIIALLVSILVPSLSTAREMARKTKCLGNFHAMGAAAAFYLHENNDYYWKYISAARYWDGLDGSGAIDVTKSPYMAYLGDLSKLWCPSQPWGSYLPQGDSVNVPTTTYGYNQVFLDPGQASPNIPTRKSSEIKRGDMMFVFADSGLELSGFHNSHVISGPTAYGPGTSPTTQFRHIGQANALCADGHAASFDPGNKAVLDTTNKLGFAGTDNKPYYAN